MNNPLAIATIAILGITAYISHSAFNNRGMLNAFMFSPDRILRDKEYQRLITSGFIHADWTHLLFNMFSLYSFGSNIELIFGPHIFLLIYIASILGGNLLSLNLHRHHDYRALGASGGVCGVIFAAIFLLPGGGVVVFPIPFALPSWLFAILFILVSFFGMRGQGGRIGHDAHLGGALCGLAVATALRPRIITQSPLLYFAVVAITGALMIYAYLCPPHLQTSNPFSRHHWQQVWAAIKTKFTSK